MTFNFKQPRYILPLLAIPFLCLFFYAWKSSFSDAKQAVPEVAGLKGTVGNVSGDVRKKELADKLDAYRNTYKDADGLTAVNVIPKEPSSNQSFQDNYTGSEKKTLDSIDKAMKAKYAVSPKTDDRALATVITGMAKRQRQVKTDQPALKEKDPMEMFRQQMAYVDSINKENDPSFKAEKQKRNAAEKKAQQKAKEVRLPVTRADVPAEQFNTIRPAANADFITAAIDENITGYAGSRLRIKLLDDIRAGNTLVKKGTLIYAQISGFAEQRVTLAVNSILFEGKILPVKLELYDLDGMPGLYVPSSAFRDFTKDLGGSSVQGVTIDGSSGGSQFVMSAASKLFQSTSSAIAELIRKNKARMKYNSYIYLIDNDALQSAQKNY